MQREHETRAQRAKAERKKWEKAVAEAVEAKLPAPPKPADATEPGPFVAPRLCLSDATIERIAVLLEARPQGLVFVADELARLFLNMQRYSNGQDNEFWLEAWNGKNFVVERQGRPPVVLDYLLVGVVGGLQPDKVARAFEGDEDGMYARFYFAWPEEPAHMPLSNEVSEIEPEIQNALNASSICPRARTASLHHEPWTCHLRAYRPSRPFGPFWHKRRQIWMAGNGNGLPRAPHMC